MKWYDINNYKPPTGTELLLRIENDIWERYITASCEDLQSRCELKTWEFSGALYDFDLNDYKITHFSILDPVEISEVKNK